MACEWQRSETDGEILASRKRVLCYRKLAGGYEKAGRGDGRRRECHTHSERRGRREGRTFFKERKEKKRRVLERKSVMTRRKKRKRKPERRRKRQVKHSKCYALTELQLV